MQFSELATLFYDFQTARIVHFLCMTAIVLFLIVHIALALLVPQSLVAMLTGGPIVKVEEPRADTQRAASALAKHPTKRPRRNDRTDPLGSPL